MFRGTCSPPCPSRFPNVSSPQAASHVGTLTGPAGRSTRLASSLRSCSSAPHGGAAFDRAAPRSRSPAHTRPQSRGPPNGGTVMKGERFDIHQYITDQIVTAIERGAGEFRPTRRQSSPPRRRRRKPPRISPRFRGSEPPPSLSNDADFPIASRILILGGCIQNMIKYDVVIGGIRYGRGRASDHHPAP